MKVCKRTFDRLFGQEMLTQRGYRLEFQAEVIAHNYLDGLILEELSLLSPVEKEVHSNTKYMQITSFDIEHPTQ